MKFLFFLKTIFILFLIFGTATAQDILSDFLTERELEPQPPEINFKTIVSKTTLKPGSTAQLAFVLDIPEGYHINDDLTVEFDEISNISFGKLRKPKPAIVTIGENKFPIYEGEVIYAVSIKTAEQIEHKKVNLQATIEYSPCSEQVCFGRFDKVLTIPIEITDNETANPDFEKFVDKIPVEDFSSTEKIEQEVPSASVTSQKAIVKRDLLAFVVAFFGGIGTVLLPCVYPMIPVIMGFIISQSKGNVFKSLTLSIFLVLGLIIPFSILGLLAAMFGLAVDRIVQYPVYILFLDAILLTLAASMFGAFELQMPASLRNRLAIGESRGILGAITMGFILTPLAFACMSGPLGGSFILISQKRNLLYGFWLMFFFGLGLGTPFVILGIFTGAIAKLPKSGPWMVTIKKVFGVLLIAMALYFSRPLFNKIWYVYVFIIGVSLVLLGTFAGAFLRLTKESRVSEKIAKVIGIIALTIGLYHIVVAMIISGLIIKFPTQPSSSPTTSISSSSISESTDGIKWIDSIEQGLAESEKSDRPVMIYFWGYNCIACTELREYTYKDEEVIEKLKEFVPVKINIDEKDGASFRKKYKIFGKPTILFLDNSGKGITRKFGYIRPKEFLRILNEVKN